ncbi:MAG: hypothetical protein HDS68_02500 [Bacteroidales bacterium]|nr:hypothetical protein [Bacteroidales bacterium]
METKICKDCGRELPLTDFIPTRNGKRMSACKSCVQEKRANTRYERAQMGGGKQPPFSDPDFDGKDPGEVVRLMGRAQRWLQSRGYTIRLDGEYTKTTVHKLKF